MDRNAVVVADVAGRIRFWSEGAEARFGYSTSEAVGQMLDLIVPPEFREAHWVGFRRAIAEGQAEAEGQPSPFPARHADGSVVATPGRLALVREPEGQVIGAMVVFTSSVTPPA